MVRIDLMIQVIFSYFNTTYHATSKSRYYSAETVLTYIKFDRVVTIRIQNPPSALFTILCVLCITCDLTLAFVPVFDGNKCEWMIGLVICELHARTHRVKHFLFSHTYVANSFFKNSLPWSNCVSFEKRGNWIGLTLGCIFLNVPV